jgi:hypothetical protein
VSYDLIQARHFSRRGLLTTLKTDALCGLRHLNRVIIECFRRRAQPRHDFKDAEGDSKNRWRRLWPLHEKPPALTLSHFTGDGFRESLMSRDVFPENPVIIDL